MISTAKLKLHAQPCLHGSKSSLALDAHKPSASTGNNRSPALLGIGNHGKRNALMQETGISHLFKNKPTQVHARNGLLNHSSISPMPTKHNTDEGFPCKPDVAPERVHQ